MEVPPDVFDISFVQCKLQGEDRGRMVASRETPMLRNTSTVFMNIVGARKRFWTGEQSKGGDHEPSK